MRCLGLRMLMPLNPVRPVSRLSRYLLVKKDVTHSANPMNMSQVADLAPVWLTAVSNDERRSRVGRTMCRDIRRRRSRILGALILLILDPSDAVVNALELMRTVWGMSVNDITHIGLLATVEVLPLTTTEAVKND